MALYDLTEKERAAIRDIYPWMHVRFQSNGYVKGQSKESSRGWQVLMTPEQVLKYIMQHRKG